MTPRAMSFSAGRRLRGSGAAPSRGACVAAVTRGSSPRVSLSVGKQASARTWAAGCRPQRAPLDAASRRSPLAHCDSPADAEARRPTTAPRWSKCVYSGAVRCARTKQDVVVGVRGRHHLRRGRPERAAPVDVLESRGLLGGPMGAGPEAGGGAGVVTLTSPPKVTVRASPRRAGSAASVFTWAVHTSTSTRVVGTATGAARCRLVLRSLGCRCSRWLPR
jgi:hypothetical protein